MPGWTTVPRFLAPSPRGALRSSGHAVGGDLHLPAIDREGRGLVACDTHPQGDRKNFAVLETDGTTLRLIQQGTEAQTGVL